MKKIISVAVALITVLSLFAGCSLFSNDALVKFDDTHTHNDPDGLTYDERIVLKGNKFADYLEDIVNSAAYPDTMVYDEEGNMIGMYDYDESTGLAKGFTSLSDEKYNEFDEPVDLGKPDTSKMIDIPGDITVGAVVYGNEEKAVSAYVYIYLSDAKATDQVKELLKEYYGVEANKDNDTTLSFVQDSDYINKTFEDAIEQGATVMAKDASTYSEFIMADYGVTVYKGENAYKPYDEYTDPEDLEYDEKVVLVGAGEYAVLEEYVADLSTMTDVLYGKDGKMVGHYTYYVCTSKEGADHLMGWLETGTSDITRVSDTVISDSKTGKNLESLITSYIGYNVLVDDTVKDYTRMIEESFFSVVCE